MNLDEEIVKNTTELNTSLLSFVLENSKISRINSKLIIDWKSPNIIQDVKQSNDKKMNQFKTNDIKQNGQVSNPETKNKNKVLKILRIQRKDSACSAKRFSVSWKKTNKKKRKFNKINVIRHTTNKINKQKINKLNKKIV